MGTDSGSGRVLTSIVAVPLGLWSLYVGFAFAIFGSLAGIAAVVQGLVAIGVGFGFFAAAYGIFTEQPWAGNLGVAVFGLDVARRLLTFATGSVRFVALSALFTAVSIGGLYYVATNRDRFAGRATASPYGAD